MSGRNALPATPHSYLATTTRFQCHCNTRRQRTSAQSALTQQCNQENRFVWWIIQGPSRFPGSRTSMPQDYWCCWHRSPSWPLQLPHVTASPASVRGDQEQHLENTLTFYNKVASNPSQQAASTETTLHQRWRLPMSIWSSLVASSLRACISQRDWLKV